MDFDKDWVSEEDDDHEVKMQQTSEDNSKIEKKQTNSSITTIIGRLPYIPSRYKRKIEQTKYVAKEGVILPITFQAKLSHFIFALYAMDQKKSYHRLYLRYYVELDTLTCNDNFSSTIVKGYMTNNAAIIIDRLKKGKDVVFDEFSWSADTMISVEHKCILIRHEYPNNNKILKLKIEDTDIQIIIDLFQHLLDNFNMLSHDDEMSQLRKSRENEIKKYASKSASVDVHHTALVSSSDNSEILAIGSDGEKVIRGEKKEIKKSTTEGMLSTIGTWFS